MSEAAGAEAGRCRGITAAGTPCKRRAGEDGFCRQHGNGAFYARALSGQDRASYLEALTQEGLSAEVAVLRLHLLRLVGRDDDERAAEIPRTVHALVRALKDGRGSGESLVDALDAAVREEGRRLLAEGAPWPAEE